MYSSVLSGRVFTAGLLTTAIAGSFLFAAPAQANDDSIRYDIKIENLSPTIITPPVAVFTDGREPLFTRGERAEVYLEDLAEGGSTDALAEVMRNRGGYVTQSSSPIQPFGTQTISVTGDDRGYLALAGMLLPTNDAFAALNSVLLTDDRTSVFYANAYDAGTELDDQLAASIPGPITGGEGFNPTRDDEADAVFLHEGLVPEVGDIDVEQFNFENPVLKVTVTPVENDDDETPDTDDPRVQRLLDRQAERTETFEARQIEQRERFEQRQQEQRERFEQRQADQKKRFMTRLGDQLSQLLERLGF